MHLAHLENHILQFINRTPLDIVALAVGDYGIKRAISEKFFSAYDTFLGLVANPEKREYLKSLRAERSGGDKIFSEVEEFSKQFDQALGEMFFNNEILSPLTAKYGVF